MNSPEPKTIGLILLFNFIFLSLCWILSRRLFWSTKSLQKHGYSKQLIEVQKRNDSLYLRLTIISFIAGQAVAVAVYLYMGYDITTELYFPNISNSGFAAVGIALLISWPFYNKRYKSECRKAAIETKSKIVIDYRQSVLNLILNRRLESAALILVLYFNIRYLGHNISLYAIMTVPWFYYYFLKQSKFLVRASITYKYKVVSILMITYQFIKALIFTSVLYEAYPGDFDSIGSKDLILIIILYIIFSITIILDVLNYPRMKRMFIDTLTDRPVVENIQ